MSDEPIVTVGENTRDLCRHLGDMARRISVLALLRAIRNGMDVRKMLINEKTLKKSKGCALQCVQYVTIRIEDMQLLM